MRFGLIQTDYHEWDFYGHMLQLGTKKMSELNHEIDRDNLNKAFVDADKEMARLLFPNGRKRYVEELDEQINAFDRGTEINREPKVWWSYSGDPANFNPVVQAGRAT